MTDLMRRNRREQFLGPREHFISILDGDQQRHDSPQDKYCIPLLNLEKALWDEYRQPRFVHALPDGESLKPKQLYGELPRSKMLCIEEILELLCDWHDAAMRTFSNTLTTFLCRAPPASQ